MPIYNHEQRSEKNAPSCVFLAAATPKFWRAEKQAKPAVVARSVEEEHFALACPLTTSHNTLRHTHHHRLGISTSLVLHSILKRRGLATACFGVSGRRVVMEYLIASIC